MNRYWCVLKTYLWRPRFWVLSATYLLVVYFWFWYYQWDLFEQREGQALISAVYANIISCFLGLHVRRQFSHAGAGLIPGYAVPHLVVAGLAGGILWLFIPLAAAWAGRWTTGAVAIHASAAILMGIVACWPRGLLLLVAIPAIAIWSGRPLPRGHVSLVQEVYRGDWPVLAGTLIVLAVVAQGLAAWLLLRLPRRGITMNDEFSFEAPTVPAGQNPLIDGLLALREVAASRLMEARLLPQVQRWRVPVATVPLTLVVPALIVAAASLFGWWLGEPMAYSSLGLAITCAILLFVPLAPWQARRHVMSQEILRPVARESYFRQVLAAMAWDVAIWIGVATVLILLVILSNWHELSSASRLIEFLGVTSAYLGLLWSMAVFTYGIGVATMRWQFWLPIVATTAIGWFFGVLFLMVQGAQVIAHWSQSTRPDRFAPLLIASFCLLNALVGFVLTRHAYRRAVHGDVG